MVPTKTISEIYIENPLSSPTGNEVVPVYDPDNPSITQGLSVSDMPISTPAQDALDNKMAKVLVTVGLTGSGCDYECSATNARTVIRQAITDLSAAGGGTLEFTADDFNFTNPMSSLNGVTGVRLKGQPGTRFVIPSANIGNYGVNNYIIQADNTGTNGGKQIIVEGIEFYGSYDVHATGSGAAIATGTDWEVKNCRFIEMGSYCVFNGSSTLNAFIHDNYFSGGGSADRIGGGTTVSTPPTNVHIYQNTFADDINANCFDNTGGDYYQIWGNVIYGNTSIYLEAMRHVDVHHNRILGGGGIGVISDDGYSPASITNSRYIDVHHNEIIGGSISYKATTDPVKSCSTGGDVSINFNTVYQPANYGILINCGSDSTTPWGTNYKILGNTIIDANESNDASANTGYAVVNPSGINVAQGLDVIIDDNTIIDSRVTPRQHYGIQIGQTFTPSPTNQPNRVSIGVNRITGYQTDDINIASSTYTTDVVNITSLNYVSKSGDSITVPNNGNTVGLTINQNDTSNNPTALNLVNTGSGITQRANTSGSARLMYLLNQGSNTGVGTHDYQLIGNHNDSTGIAIISQRNASGSGTVLKLQNLGTGTTLDVDGLIIADYLDLGFYAQGNITGATTFTRVNGSTITATLTGNVTATITDGVVAGDTLTLILTQDGTGSRTISTPANVKAIGGYIKINNEASSVCKYTFVWDGTNWQETARVLQYEENVVTKTANYTAVLNDDFIKCDATSGAITVTLPAAATSKGKVYNIKKIDSSVNTVTIDGNASETIDGATTVVISSQYTNYRIYCNGTAGWDVQ